MNAELIPYDSEEHFRSTDEQMELLQDALQSGDYRYIAEAIGVIAKARGMPDVAKATGISLDQLSRKLRANGNPSLDTVTKVLSALGFRLRIEPA